MNKRERLTGPCFDCGFDTFDGGEYYMLHDRLWEKIAPEDKGDHDFFLCIGCVENRLERELNKDDFPMSILANSQGEHSERLQKILNN